MMQSHGALQLGHCGSALLSRLTEGGKEVVHAQHPLHLWILQHIVSQVQLLHTDHYVAAQVRQLLQQNFRLE